MNQTTVAQQSPSAAYLESNDDEIDLRQLFGVLSAGRITIIGFVLGALILGAFYSWVTARQFESSALVQVEMTGKSSLEAALGDLGSALGQQEAPVAAELELLKSRMVVGRVVDTLREFISAEPDYFPVIGRAIARAHAERDAIRDAPFGLRQYAWGGERIRVTNLETADALVGKPLQLTAGAGETFSVRHPNGRTLVEEGRVGELVQVSTDFGPVVLFVQELRAAPGTRFNLVRRQRNRAIAALVNEISVSERGRQSGILSVTAGGPSPARAAARVNAIVQSYQRQNVERKSQEAQQTLAFLDNQLPELKQELEASEARLNDYRLREGSVDLTRETQLVLEQSVELERRRNELEQRRKEAAQRFTPDHPVMQTIDAQLADLRADRQSITQEVGRLPETQQRLLRLTRDVEVNTQLYTSLLNSAQELRIVRAGTVGNVRIVDLGIVPEAASSPKVGLIIALSLVLGGMLGVVAVFLRRAMQSGVTDPSRVERELGLSTYASIPYSPQQKRLDREFKSRRAKSGQMARLLTFEQGDDVSIEALRSLRTSLHFALLDTPSKVITITGPSPGLGKSFLAANFGAVVAEAGNKVVVVDADLRRGHLHERFGINRAPGLSDYIAGNSEASEVINACRDSDRLFVITTGVIAPNPSELLLNERFETLLRLLETQFDYVIVDTPPILAVTDAAIVGRLGGATLMVLKEGEHSMAMIADAVQRLKNGGVNVRGTVFNQMGRKAGKYGQTAYGYQYGYTYKYQSKKA